MPAPDDYIAKPAEPKRLRDAPDRRRDVRRQPPTGDALPADVIHSALTPDTPASGGPVVVDGARIACAPSVLHVEQLRSVLGEDRDMWREMLSLFVTSNAPLPETMKTAIKGADGETVRRAAQQLMGGAATVGAEEAAQISARLEGRAKQGVRGHAEELRVELAGSFERLVAAVPNLRSLRATG